MEIRKLMEEMKDVLFILLVTAFFASSSRKSIWPKARLAYCFSS